MSSVTREPTTLYQRCVKLHQAIRTAPDDEGKVNTYKRTGLSMIHYGQTYYYLEELGCIEIVRDGAKLITRVLKDVPAPDDFEQEIQFVRRLSSRRSLASIEQALVSLEERIPPINLNRFLLSLDTRVKEIEERLSILEDTREV